MASTLRSVLGARTARRLALGVGLGVAGGWAYGLVQGRPAPSAPLAAGSAGAGAPTPPAPVEVQVEAPADPPVEVQVEPEMATDPGPDVAPVSVVDGSFNESPVDDSIPEGQIVDDEDTTVTLAATVSTESMAADPLLAARERAKRRLAGE